jgi:N-sulfoglucosamine sulfohydrolase
MKLSRRVLMFAIAAIAAATLTVVWSSSRATASARRPEPQRPTARPNILWISAEDLSPDLGCYGDAYARTPNLDKFAREGVRYTHAFATSPVCAPSRSAIITAMYPPSIGTHHMRSKAVPPAHVKAFTEPLRAAGYYCTNNVKTDYNFEAPPAHRPPDSVWDESSNRAHWRNRADKAQPFFAVFNLTVTHESQIRATPDQYAKNTARLKAADRHDPKLAPLPPYYPDTPLVRKDWATYHDNITAMDYAVADILKQLEEDGLAENTIVFFWGDHGRGLPRAKRWPYDSGLRVPLVVRWPGRIKAGTVSDEIVSLHDLGPTVLSIAGVRIPAHVQGQAFLGEQKAKPREYAFGHRDRMDEAYDMMRTARDKQFRYIRNFQPGKPYAQHIDYMDEMPTMKEMRRVYKEHMNALSPDYRRAMTAAQLLFFAPEKPEEELYDLAADPHEINNLARDPKHRATLLRMRAAVEKWMKETNDLGLVPETELIERMRPGGVWATTERPVLSLKGGTFNAPVTVKVSCPTPGASIVYTTEEGERARWKLYGDGVRLTSSARLRVKACRYGYKDSEEVTASYEIGKAAVSR